MTGDPYAVLGVGRDSTDDEISAAWERRVAAAAEAGDLAATQRVDAAYEVLRHPSRRTTFDRSGVIPEARRMPPDESYFAAAPATGFRTWTPAPPGRVRGSRRERLRSLLVTLVAGAVAGMLWHVGVLHQSPAAALRSDIWGSDSSFTDSEATPPTHSVDNPHRLLPAATAPSGLGGYSERSARWDPCQPIRYVVSGYSPFGGGDQLLRSAIAEVSHDTGLSFVDAGTTNEVASESRAPYQPLRYGDQWAPVLIAWTDSSAVPALTGPVVGLGGAAGATTQGKERLVSGIVYLDGPEMGTMLLRPTGSAEIRAVMLHELGHLVGLQHVNDPTAVMYPVESPDVPDFSAGDLRGFAHAGSGPCLNVR